jgi:hypothetical protein
MKWTNRPSHCFMNGITFDSSAIPIRHFMTILFSLTLSLYLTLGHPSFVITPQPDSIQLPSIKAAPGIFISEWEPAASWKPTKYEGGIQYSILKVFPQLKKKQLQDSELIVFVKGYQFKDSFVRDKPLSLPFCQFIAEKEFLKPLYWSFTATLGQLNITLQAPLELEEKLEKARENVQFRYFLLDKAFLKQQKLTPKALRNLSYQQLIQLAVITP